MIGDIVLDARLTYNKLNRDISQQFDLGDLAIRLNVRGGYCEGGRGFADTTDAVLPIGRITNIGYVCIRSMDSALIDTPVAPVIYSTGGATQYAYKIVAIQDNGNNSTASPAGTINGPATLDGGHFNIVTWYPVSDATQGYDVYRTQGGVGQGKIGNVLTPPLQLTDNGLAAVGGVPPATSPNDYQIQFGPSVSSYPLLVRGNDIHVFRWNSAVVGNIIHYKAILNMTFFAYLLIDS